MLADVLNPDGQFSDDDRARRRSLPLGAQGRLGSTWCVRRRDVDEGVAEVVGWRAGGVAGLVIGLDCQDPIAAGIANEISLCLNPFGLRYSPGDERLG